MGISRLTLFKLLAGLGIVRKAWADTEWDDLDDREEYLPVENRTPLPPAPGSVQTYDCVSEYIFTDPGFLRGQFYLQPVDESYVFDKAHRTTADLCGQHFNPAALQTSLVIPEGGGLKLDVLQDVVFTRDWPEKGYPPIPPLFLRGWVVHRDDGRLLTFTIFNATMCA